MGKSSVLGVLADHLGTLRDSQTKKPRIQDYVFQFLAPVLLGTAVTLRGLRLSDVGQTIAGLAVLVGFTFGLIIFVFQLRVQVTNDPRIPKTGRLVTLLDELFSNVSYAVLAGLTAVTVAVAAASFGTTTPPSTALNGWRTATLIALLSHFLIELGMCLKRTRRAYQVLKI